MVNDLYYEETVRRIYEKHWDEAADIGMPDRSIGSILDAIIAVEKQATIKTIATIFKTLSDRIRATDGGKDAPE